MRGENVLRHCNTTTTYKHNKSIQFHTDLDVTLSLKSNNAPWDLWSVAMVILSNISLSSSPPLFLALCAGLDWPFGNLLQLPGVSYCSSHLFRQHAHRVDTVPDWLALCHKCALAFHPPLSPGSHFVFRAFSLVYSSSPRWTCYTSLARLMCSWMLIEAFFCWQLTVCTSTYTSRDEGDLCKYEYVKMIHY